VSKVLRNHPDIGETTRKRVRKRMRELNYQPNLAARSLITGQTWTFGIIVPDLLHPFFAQIVKGISAEVRKKGYSLFISSSDEDPKLEQQEIMQLLARRVDVLLIASAQQSVESFQHIQEQKIPYILLDRRFAGMETNFVGVDDRAIGFLATEHLVQQGCRRIAHVRGPEVSTAIGRLAGYMQALEAARLPVHPADIISIGSSGDHRGERGGYEAARKLLFHANRPDGIFCFNDPVALGAMRAILEAGLRIPEDIAVVGCGNLSYSDFLRVPLSSIDQGTAAIAKAAAGLGLRLAHNKIAPRMKSELIVPQLVVRASSLRDLASHPGARTR
jgi:LacI family transcriptional regulator